MEETTIKLEDELVNYLQVLDFEIGGLQVLHTHALNAGLPREKVREICRQFQETYAEYQLAKRELWSAYNKDYPNCRWWVDFQEGVLHIAQKQT